MRPPLLALLLLALFAAVPAPAGAATSDCTAFAAPDGADRGDGTAESPFRSPQRLVDALGPGDTGCLRGGRYTKLHNGYIARFGDAGTARAPIALRSAPGERAILVGTVMVAHGADHVRLSDIDVVGTGTQNTVKIYGADVVVENADITNQLRGDSCMILGSSSGGRAVRPVIRRNVFHDCGSPDNGNQDHGIYAAKVTDAEIVDNLFSNTAAYSIQLYPDAQRSHVARNILDGGPATVRGGIVIGGDSRSVSKGNVVERNIITHAATAGVYGYWEKRVGRNNLVRDNCVWAARGDAVDAPEGGLTVGRNITANPGFRDRGGRDYRLAADNPCRRVVGATAAAELIAGVSAF